MVRHAGCDAWSRDLPRRWTGRRGRPRVLTFVLLLGFVDAHVPRGVRRLWRGRTVVLESPGRPVRRASTRQPGGGIVGASGGGLQGCPRGVSDPGGPRRSSNAARAPAASATRPLSLDLWHFICGKPVWSRRRGARGGGRRVCHGAPATSAPVDHAAPKVGAPDQRFAADGPWAGSVARLTGGRWAGRQPARNGPRRLPPSWRGGRLGPGRPALWAGTGPASRRGRSPTSRRGARLRIDRKPVGGLGSRLRGQSVSPPPLVSKGGRASLWSRAREASARRKGDLGLPEGAGPLPEERRISRRSASRARMSRVSLPECRG